MTVRMTKTMLKQLAWCAKVKGDPVAGQGNGDYNRYHRMHGAGYVALVNGRFVITDAGRAVLSEARARGDLK